MAATPAAVSVSRPRRAASAAFAVLLIAALAAAYLLRIRHQMPDFEVYWRAGGRALAGEALYRVEDGHYQLKYLPAFAVLIAPIALLPLPAAKALWFVVSSASLTAFLLLSVRLLPVRRIAGRRLGLLTLLLMLKFYGHELTLGQTNAVLAAAVMLALRDLMRRREGGAGGWLTAAVAAKPYGLAFVPYLLLTRRRAACVWLAAGIALLLALPAMTYGASSAADLLSEWGALVVESSPGLLLGQDNVSVWAMWAKWLGPGRLSGALALATLVGLGSLFVASITWRTAAARGPEYLEVAMLLTLVPLASPQGWDYTLLLATPAVALLLNHLASFGPAARAAILAALVTMGLSLYDVMGREAYAAFMSVSSVTICALIAIAALASLRWKGVA